MRGVVDPAGLSAGVRIGGGGGHRQEDRQQDKEGRQQNTRGTPSTSLRVLALILFPFLNFLYYRGGGYPRRDGKIDFSRFHFFCTYPSMYIV